MTWPPIAATTFRSSACAETTASRSRRKPLPASWSRQGRPPTRRSRDRAGRTAQGGAGPPCSADRKGARTGGRRGRDPREVLSRVGLAHGRRGVNPSVRGRPGEDVEEDVFAFDHLQADPKRAQGDRAKGRGAELHRILLSGQGDLRRDLANPVGQTGRCRRPCRRGDRGRHGIRRSRRRGPRASAGILRDCRSRRTPREADRASEASGSSGSPSAEQLQRRMPGHGPGERSGLAVRPSSGSPDARRPRRDPPARARRPRPASASRSARGAIPGGTFGQGRTGRGRRAARCPGRGPAGDAGSRRRGRAARSPAPRPRSSPASAPVAALEVGDVGKVLLEDPALVVQALASARTPAEDRDSVSPRPTPAGDALDHRRLARPAERQVADRDDRDLDPVDGLPAAVEREVSGGDSESIGNARARQAEAKQGGTDPPRLAADETEIGGGVGIQARPLR